MHRCLYVELSLPKVSEEFNDMRVGRKDRYASHVTTYRSSHSSAKSFQLLEPCAGTLTLNRLFETCQEVVVVADRDGGEVALE